MTNDYDRPLTLWQKSIVVAVAVGIICLFAFFVHWETNRINQIDMNNGAAAFRSGAPASANPYIGRNMTGANWWLHGWTKAAQENR